METGNDFGVKRACGRKSTAKVDRTVVRIVKATIDRVV